jgi:hypothetical protein
MRSHVAPLIAASALLTGLLACERTPAPPPPLHSRQVVSEVYTIDRVYKSMQGPSSWIHTSILPGQPGELIWVTGYRAEVVGPDGKTVLSPDFMCHSNLSFDAADHAQRFGWTRRTSNRLFTVSQGQAEVQFPEGFGIPLMSDEPLAVQTQALNHNWPDTTAQIRVRVTIDYVRQQDLSEPFVPLYMTAANALVLLDGTDGNYGAPPDDMTDHGTGATEGTPASSRVISDHYGRRFSGHWVVPPGHQVHRTPVTNWMRLGTAPTVYYIAVHVHPFATSVTLTDLTAGRVVFTSDVAPIGGGKIGIAKVGTYSDPNGIPLAGDHEYEMTTVYDNTSGVDQEAMAVMYLYLRDDEFQMPTATSTLQAHATS